MYRNTTRLASLFGNLALVMSAVALAGPGGKNASTSSISLASTSAPALAAARATVRVYGDSVTFDVSTDPPSSPSSI